MSHSNYLRALFLTVVASVGAAGCGSSADTAPGGSGGQATGTGGSTPLGTGGIVLGTGGDGGTGDPCASENPPPECAEITADAACGDGVNNRVDENAPLEACDDGNTLPGDGCSGACQVEPNFECPLAGPCTSTIVCGNGTVEGAEICDDGDTIAGNGCYADCLGIDAGYVCPIAGGPCEPPPPNPCEGPTPPLACSGGGTTPLYCGDGIVSAGEACDDSDGVPGDGCSGTCQVEPNYACPPAGGPCTSTIACGNGAREGTESCDDENTTASDGCSSTCTVEAGYYCPTPGEPCLPLASCGDGRIQTGEVCDDGNTTANDGCTAQCRVQAGWRCLRPNEPCEEIPVCGDGVAEAVAGEQCDDGDTEPGDGCNASCRIEASYWDCPAAGGPCVNTQVCGNGVIELGEECDDGPDNRGANDGCTNACRLTLGYVCRVAGRACAVDCGDGRLLVPEECDDGNTAANDGCSPTCRFEPGWVCDGGECEPSVCGDGTPEGSESCDDGNTRPFDGCSPTCVKEPSCGTSTSAVGPCSSTCGDGIFLPGEGEACDDGNTIGGDGCSADCKTVEPGYECGSAYDDPPATLDIPIVYRDFSNTHPDFGDFCCNAQTGIVQNLLDVQRKPVYAGTNAAPITSTSGKTAFDQWYRDVPSVNYTFYETLTLRRNATTGAYSMNSDTDAPWFTRCGFYPLEDIPRLDPNTGLPVRYCRGGGNPDQQACPASDPRICYAGDGWGYGEEWLNHNYLFTSELRYWFEYQGGEQLDFSGDDDVWVFINGRLAVDLGGVHPRMTGSVTLNAAMAASHQLTLGKVYEVVLLQAERWCCDSNYWLTLSNFVAGRTTCLPDCGNEVATGLEECDLGDCPDADGECNDGAYGSCTDACRWGSFCGDGVVDAPAEGCDNGINTDLNYTGPTACAPGCRVPPHCGDGQLDPGEDCDLGACPGTACNDGEYGGCNANCTLAPYCGNGAKETGEECDDGLNIGGYGQCFPACRLGDRCGDGAVQAAAGELCDDGNTVNGDGCSNNCGLEGFCGDGILQAELGETCDDGVNDGSYGHCTPDCQGGPRCGDALVQGAEECDDGVNAGGYGECAAGCRFGPYCGDGVADVSFGEECDDGINDGTVSNCIQGCRLSEYCGDGVVQAASGEECDDGVNDGGYNQCYPGCRIGPRCGDSQVQPEQEVCDDGVNDGGYGECFPGCRYGTRCGDAQVQASEGEQCDEGVVNGLQGGDGGYGECFPGCRLGSYCGDGTLQTLYEQCDDGNNTNGDGCSSACRVEVQ